MHAYIIVTTIITGLATLVVVRNCEDATGFVAILIDAALCAWGVWLLAHGC